MLKNGFGQYLWIPAPDMSSLKTYLLIWVDKLSACVPGQHVNNDNLTPFLHINQQIAQLPVILVNQVYALRTHFLKGLNGTTSH